MTLSLGLLDLDGWKSEVSKVSEAVTHSESDGEKSGLLAPDDALEPVNE